MHQYHLDRENGVLVIALDPKKETNESLKEWNSLCNEWTSLCEGTSIQWDLLSLEDYKHIHVIVTNGNPTNSEALFKKLCNQYCSTWQHMQGFNNNDQNITMGDIATNISKKLQDIFFEDHALIDRFITKHTRNTTIQALPAPFPVDNPATRPMLGASTSNASMTGGKKGGGEKEPLLTKDNSTTPCCTIL